MIYWWCYFLISYSLFPLIMILGNWSIRQKETRRKIYYCKQYLFWIRLNLTLYITWPRDVKVWKTWHLLSLSEEIENWDMHNFAKHECYSLFKNCITHMKERLKFSEHDHCHSTKVFQSVTPQYFFYRVSMVLFEGRKGIGK